MRTVNITFFMKSGEQVTLQSDSTHESLDKAAEMFYDACYIKNKLSTMCIRGVIIHMDAVSHIIFTERV